MSDAEEGTKGAVGPTPSAPRRVPAKVAQAPRSRRSVVERAGVGAATSGSTFVATAVVREASAKGEGATGPVLMETPSEAGGYIPAVARVETTQGAVMLARGPCAVQVLEPAPRGVRTTDHPCGDH